jgi:hypothetical protein
MKVFVLLDPDDVASLSCSVWSTLEGAKAYAQSLRDPDPDELIAALHDTADDGTMDTADGQFCPEPLPCASPFSRMN